VDIYAVVHWMPVHAPCCTSFNAQYEKVRMPVDGVFLSKENAKKAAASANKNRPSRAYPKAYVVAYKVRDSASVSLAEFLQPLKPEAASRDE